MGLAAAVGSRESLLGCSACASLEGAQEWGCSLRYRQMSSAFPGCSDREPRICRRALRGEVRPPRCPLSPATSQQADIEQLDPRGRTPLHLATTLGHLECARVLLKHGADVGKENRSGWTVLQEAVSTRDLELVQLVLRYRDYQRAIKRLAGIPILLEKLRKAQDFYVEMKWEFTSWGKLGAERGWEASGSFPAESPSPSIHPQDGGHLALCPPPPPKLADPRPTKAWGSPDVSPTQLSAGSPLGGAGWPHPRLGYRRLSPVPLVSKICPSDTYKVWKSGQNLRVDTTLLGFDHMTWQRGNRSFVFRGQDTSAVVMEIDHDRRVVYSETLALAGHDQEVLLAAVQPTEEQVMGRLTAPVVTTQLDTKNIAFERWAGGGTEPPPPRPQGARTLGCPSETIHCSRCFASPQEQVRDPGLEERKDGNGEWVRGQGLRRIQRGADHADADRAPLGPAQGQEQRWSRRGPGGQGAAPALALTASSPAGSKTPLQSFLGIAEQHVGPNNGTLITQTLSHANPTAITPEEYFNPNFELGNRDMGRPMELTTKTQKFKAKLWLCEDHPLSLCEQVAPIIDLMAISNALFAKLRDFITLRLPPGFPVKIEIPIFHILNARITFGNLNGCDEPVSSLRHSPSSEAPSPSSDSSSVSSSSSLTSCRACEMDPALFEVPRGYSVVGTHQDALREDEDDLLQFAIQQSLLEAGSEYDQVTIWEALTNSKPGTHPMSHESRRGDRTPQHTAAPRPPVTPAPGGGGGGPSALFPSYAEQLRLAMALSAREQEEAERRTRQEEEELQRILQLSLTEK
ncbi:ankyrin repeat domain-containing protein 13B isoform 2-T2 [Morphnus guianensis]